MKSLNEKYWSPHANCIRSLCSIKIVKTFPNSMGFEYSSGENVILSGLFL